MKFRFLHRLLGGHVHVRVFSNGAKSGDLVFSQDEWDVLRSMLGTLLPFGNMEIEDEADAERQQVSLGLTVTTSPYVPSDVAYIIGLQEQELLLRAGSLVVPRPRVHLTLDDGTDVAVDLRDRIAPVRTCRSTHPDYCMRNNACEFSASPCPGWAPMLLKPDGDL